jgi:enamine deaminase RidA (YjgF/YER057c/UK114 family)
MSILVQPSQLANFERRTCGEHTIVIHTAVAKEIFVQCASTSSVFLSERPEAQAVRCYARLAEVLDAAGAGMEHVITERIFFRDLRHDFRGFAGVRRAAYQKAKTRDADFPVAVYLGQSPCCPAGRFAIQAYAVVPHSAESGAVASYCDDGQFPARKVVRLGNHRHLYTGAIQTLDSGTPFREDGTAMFEKAANLLAAHGSSFPCVLRTWCYLRDIDRDYSQFNHCRNAFFQRRGVRRYPASTGVGAELNPATAQFALCLHALLDPHAVTIEPMHAATLNEAVEYGSSFSRGLKVCLPEKTLLHVSGTASIDEQGKTAHEGDIRPQIERTLRNVRELLKPQSAEIDDFVAMLVYLKSPDHRDEFVRIWNQLPTSHIPCTIVQCELCRPNLLCEVEALAVLPPKIPESRKAARKEQIVWTASQPKLCKHGGEPAYDNKRLSFDGCVAEVPNAATVCGDGLKCPWPDSQ